MKRRAPPAVGVAMRGVIAVAALALVAVAVALWQQGPGSPPRPDLERALGRDGDSASRAAAGTKAAVAADISAYRPLPRADGLEIETPVPAPPVSMPTPPAGSAPRVAIVIDDLGRSVGILERLAALGVPLSYAVLPFESQTDAVVAWLTAHDAEILCHLPMEPESGLDPGPGALYRSMSRDQLRGATESALDRVPGAVGANNHMGSGLSAEPPAMRAVLDVLRGRGLFYLDSRTTAATVGYSEARALGMRAAERNVFLDNDRDPAAIRAQLAALFARAAEHGSAIGIAHPYPETLEVLAAEVEAAVRRGFTFVPASALTVGSVAAARAHEPGE